MKKLFMFVIVLLIGLSSFSSERQIGIGGYLVFFDREGEELIQPIQEEEEVKEEIPKQISIRIEKRPYDIFRNNWSGLELGYNGVIGDGFDLYWKSVNVRLNLIQKNLFIINNRMGVYTGLGFSWDNYRFDNSKIITSTPEGIEFTDDGVEYDKNKLTPAYVNVPLLIEWQTISPRQFKRFHIAGGMNIGYLMKNHTKQVIKNGSREKFKNRDDFHLNQFRYDVVAKIGWGGINLYGTYALNTLFEDEKGPELTPFSVGIRILNL